MMLGYLRLVLVLLLGQLGYYDRRDLFRHWIKREQRANQACGHACCRGMRAHPDHWPLNPPNRYLRRATDNELAAYYTRHADNESPEANAGREHVFAELQRRDVAEARREATEERKRARWAAKRQQRAAEVDRVWLQAEEQTKGNMLNRRGREAHINERSLFTGPESRVRKYGSDELIAYFEEHGRPTEAFFAGHDTRLGYANAGIRRRMTSEEAAWRDRYERDITWPIDEGIAA